MTVYLYIEIRKSNNVQNTRNRKNICLLYIVIFSGCDRFIYLRFISLIDVNLAKNYFNNA